MSQSLAGFDDEPDISYDWNIFVLMAKQFGKTWWGEQWLKSLAHIDFSNRLPRGATYARKGSVATLSIDENVIEAKVKGSLPRPYHVTIKIPRFSPDEVSKLVSAIAGKPVIISKLLNRELDPALLQIAAHSGLKVFPDRWRDFAMACSCPDSAVPCKHLAAVIYKVSEEIDNNPLLVFRLHGVDLQDELRKEHIYIVKDHAPIPSLKDLLGVTPEKAKGGAGKQEVAPVFVGTTGGALTGSLDFSALAPLTDALIRLLPNDPVFYTYGGNFRDKYALMLQKAVRTAAWVVEGKAGLESLMEERVPARGRGRKSQRVVRDLPTLKPHTVVELSLSLNHEAEATLNDTGERIPVPRLLALLWEIPPDRLADYQPSVAALRAALLLALNLLANGAVVPRLFVLASGSYGIRWLPALLSKEVRAVAERLEPLMPPGIMTMDNQCLQVGASVGLLPVLLGALMSSFTDDAATDRFLEIFFKGGSYRFDKAGETALPGGISTWLQRYYIAQGIYRPSIIVDERKDGRFQVNIHIGRKDKPMGNQDALKNVLTLKKFEKDRFAILPAVTQLSSFIPGLDGYINSGGEEEIIMETKSFTPFLLQVVPAIRLLDVPVLLPRALQHILRPRASVRVKTTSGERTGFLRLDKLLDFDWQVAMGNDVIGPDEFKKLMKSSEGLIKYKTGYIYVSPEDLEKLQRQLDSSRQLSTFELLRSALAEEYKGAHVVLTKEVRNLIGRITAQVQVPSPRKLEATLRPYQERGFSWIHRNAQLGFGSVLADDMGLGKTIQVIATLLKYKEEKSLDTQKVLVVAPTGLLTNWLAELEKFGPSLRCRLYHGAERKLGAEDNFDILLTSYGTVRRDAAELKKVKWKALVIDEAQNIKNHETAQTKAIKSIPAGNFIAMSGTPVENRLSELWSIMDFCNRGFLGSLKDFRESFAIPIQNRNDAEAAERLKKITAPFLMRRLKSDKSIISDLPDKLEMDAFCHLTKEQAGLYKKTLEEAMDTINGLDTNQKKSLFLRQGLVLQMVLALKQICNHPTQFLKNQVLDPSLSGKTEMLFDELETILDAGEKVLVFTQFTEMGSLLKSFIGARFGDEPLFYHGGCTLKQRREMVETFQHNPADKIFLLSLKAAGTGLNLTAASHVIHYDLWWNPAVEAQATDRAYRIGQKSNVMVHRFITKDTFEERINEMIQGKKRLANMTVAAGENWIGNMSNGIERSIPARVVSKRSIKPERADPKKVVETKPADMVEVRGKDRHRPARHP